MPKLKHVEIKRITVSTYQSVSTNNIAGDFRPSSLVARVQPSTRRRAHGVVKQQRQIVATGGQVSEVGYVEQCTALKE